MFNLLGRSCRRSNTSKGSCALVFFFRLMTPTFTLGAVRLSLRLEPPMLPSYQVCSSSVWQGLMNTSESTGLNCRRLPNKDEANVQSSVNRWCVAGHK